MIGAERNLPISRFSEPPAGGASETAEIVEQSFAGKVVLITGGSRDIGAGIVKNLAKRGAAIVAGYNNKSKRADAVAKDIAQFGNPFEFVPGDITTTEGINALTEAVDRVAPQKPDQEGQIDLLILNAASSTRELNVTGNNALIDAALPKMKKGGKIVYMQSGPGHYNSVLAPVGLVPDVYTGVASTKDEAERSIEARLEEMQAQEVSLVRFVAPAIPDSSNVRMFKSRDREAASKFDEISQKLGIPEVMSVDEVSKSVVDVLERDTGSDHLELFGPHLDGRHTLKGIYGESAIYPDATNTDDGIGRMIVTPDRAGRQFELLTDEGSADMQEADAAVNTIQPEHAEGHFRPESGLPLVLPGHKHIRLAVDTLNALVGMHTLSNEEAETEEPYSRLVGFDQVTFSGPIKPGERVVVKTNLTDVIKTDRPHGDGSLFQADAELSVNGEMKTQIKGLMVQTTESGPEQVILEDQMIEFAAQSAAQRVLAEYPDRKPLFASIGRARFTGIDVTPGTSLMAIEQDTRIEGRRFFGSSIIADQDGNLVGEIENMQGVIASPALIRKALGV